MAQEFNRRKAWMTNLKFWNKFIRWTPRNRGINVRKNGQKQSFLLGEQPRNRVTKFTSDRAVCWLITREDPKDLNRSLPRTTQFNTWWRGRRGRPKGCPNGIRIGMGTEPCTRQPRRHPAFCQDCDTIRGSCTEEHSVARQRKEILRNRPPIVSGSSLPGSGFVFIAARVLGELTT